MESPAKRVRDKIELSRALVKKASEIVPEISKHLVSIASIELRFILVSTPLLASHSVRDLACAIESENLVADVDAVIASTIQSMRASGLDVKGWESGDTDNSVTIGKGKRKVDDAQRRADIQKLLSLYPRDGDVYSHIPSEHETCGECGAHMGIDAGRSILQCSACGAQDELVGTVFDDSQFYSLDGQKSRSGTFNPNRHFQFWWTHILAREPEEELGDKDDPANLYGEKIIAVLRLLIKRDHKILRLITVVDVRRMLRELEPPRTDLNKNVALLMKKLTGLGPPNVSDDVSSRVERFFTMAIEAGEKIKRRGRVNRTYYPYYIYKIIQQMDDPSLMKVLYYIYVQGSETVEADDAHWELICREVPQLTYKPTQRGESQKYAPV